MKILVVAALLALQFCSQARVATLHDGGTAQPTGDDDDNGAQNMNPVVHRVRPWPGTNLTFQVATVAPAPVWFNALQVPLSSGNVRKSLYEWDFDDAGSQDNALVGFYVSHVYRKAGTYQAKVTVTEVNGTTHTHSQTITVDADVRPTLYVSAAGNDANDGSSADRAVKTLVRLQVLINNRSNIRVLFRRGDTFESAGLNLLVGGAHVYIGVYGSGERPTIKSTVNNVHAVGLALISIQPQARDVVVEGLRFDSVRNADSSENGMPVAILDKGTGGMANDLSFGRVGAGYSVIGASSGHMLMNSTCEDLLENNIHTGLRAYMSWIEGADWSIMHNKCSYSANEHIFRSSDWDASRFFIYDNDIQNLAKTVLNFRGGTDIYIAHNTFRNAYVSFGPTLAMPAGVVVSNVVIDSNHFVTGPLEIAGGTADLLARNNLFGLVGDPQIYVEASKRNDASYSGDLIFSQNTGGNTSTEGEFMKITDAKALSLLQLRNNLYASPVLKPAGYNAAAIVSFVANTKTLQASGNVWPASTDPKMFYYDTGSLNLSEWNSRFGGPDIQAPVGLKTTWEADRALPAEVLPEALLDFRGNRRTASTNQAGAMSP